MKYGFMDIKIDSKTVICFDLDDTLYPEIEFLKSAYREIAYNVNPDNWRKLYFEMFSRYRSGENAFDYVASISGKSIPVLLEYYVNHKPTLTPNPGALSMIYKIKAKGGSIAIITDGRSVTQRNKIRALQLESSIDLILISDETGFEKPQLNNFIRVMEELSGDVYWYLADNLKKDFIAPSYLNWSTVGIIDNGLNIHLGGHNYLCEANEPDYFVLNLQEINIL